jgi:hypothetical protein
MMHIAGKWKIGPKKSKVLDRLIVVLISLIFNDIIFSHHFLDNMRLFSNSATSSTWCIFILSLIFLVSLVCFFSRFWTFSGIKSSSILLSLSLTIVCLQSGAHSHRQRRKCGIGPEFPKKPEKIHIFSRFIFMSIFRQFLCIPGRSCRRSHMDR